MVFLMAAHCAVKFSRLWFPGRPQGKLLVNLGIATISLSPGCCFSVQRTARLAAVQMCSEAGDKWQHWALSLQAEF